MRSSVVRLALVLPLSLAACGGAGAPGVAGPGSGAAAGAASPASGGAGAHAPSAAGSGPGAAAGAASAASHDQERAMMLQARAAGSTPEDRFGPLDVGADYASYRKLTRAPFQSLDHGNRWVDVYVNEIGADAYLRGTKIPVGTTIVKTSWENDHGKPSTYPGPIYVMQKRAPGYAPAHGDWYFAIRWAKPTPAALRKFGGPIYWRGNSPKIAYCARCHDSYDQDLGGLVPSSQLPR